MTHEGHGKVLIIVQNLPVPFDRRVWLECQTLRAAGYQVSVICPKGPGDPGFETLDGIHLYKYPPAPQAEGVLGYSLEFVWSWLCTAGLSVRVLRRHGFDVIQACNPPDTYWALALPYKLLRRRFVFDQHDLCPEVYVSRFGAGSRPALERLLRWLERATYRVADHVISTNESYKRIAMVRGLRQACDVTVVRSGPDTTRMKREVPEPTLSRGHPFLAVYLGVMGPQDGVDGLVRAWSVLVHELGRDDCHLALLGFGDCLNELQTLSVELGIERHVTFTGRADASVISRYLSTADLGICPDPHSPLNNVSTMNKTMEYMAFGLPVVSFDLPETAVSAGDAAVYVPGNDPRDLARAVAQLLDDPPLRAELGRRGRQRAVQALDWCVQAPNYVAVFDQLVNAGKRDLVVVADPAAPGAFRAFLERRKASRSVVIDLVAAGVPAQRTDWLERIPNQAGPGGLETLPQRPDRLQIPNHAGPGGQKTLPQREGAGG